MNTLGSLFGESFPKEVKRQIELREYIFGQGLQPEGIAAVNSDLFQVSRTEQIRYLHANTSWVKMLSSVDVDSSSRFKNTAIAGIITTTIDKSPNNLASNFILNAGVQSTTSGLRGGLDIAGEKVNINDPDRNGRDSFGYPILPQGDAYGVGGLEYGIKPMPGIISATVEHLNNGTLRKAVIAIKAYNRAQFEIIDALYLRLGFTILLEWGHTILAKGTEPDSITYETNPGSLYSVQTEFLNNKTSAGKLTFENFLTKIRQNRLKSEGNYDGFIGRITNFSWEVAPDGSYNITINAVSEGDIIESINMNVAGSLPTADNQTANATTANAFGFSLKPANAEPADGAGTVLFGVGKNILGDFIYQTLDNLTKGFDTPKALKPLTEYEIRDEPPPSVPLPRDAQGNVIDPMFEFSKGLARNADQKLSEKAGFATTFFQRELAIESRMVDVVSPDAVAINFVNVQKETADPESIRRIEEGEPVATKISEMTLQYYIRFGALLKWIESDVIYKSLSDLSPIIKVDYDVENNLIPIDTYTVPADPSVCIFKRVGVKLFDVEVQDFEKRAADLDVKNVFIQDQNVSTRPTETQQFNQDFKKAKKQLIAANHTDTLNFFPSIDNEFEVAKDKLANAGRIMNAYFNADFLVTTFESVINTQTGKASVYNFLQKLCDGFNASTGNYNKLTVFYDEDVNTLKIIDKVTPPNYKDFLKYTGASTDYSIFNAYGFRKPKANDVYYSGTFIKNFSIRTELSKDTSAMIATAAAANSQNILGLESTMFSKWNEGLYDRILEGITNTKPALTTQASTVNTMRSNFAKLGNLLGTNESAERPVWSHRYPTDDKPVWNPQQFQTFRGWAATMVKYHQNELAMSNETQNTSVGFLPIKLSLTMKGLSGMKILQEFKIYSDFLPSNYPESLRFLVTNIKHELQNSQWSTTIETIVAPETTTNIVDERSRRDVQQLKKEASVSEIDVTPSYRGTRKQIIDALGWPIEVRQEGSKYFGQLKQQGKTGPPTYFITSPTYKSKVETYKVGKFTITSHIDAKPTFIKLFQDITAAGYDNLKYFDSLAIGSFNPRSLNNDKGTLSGHAWGLSLDINSTTFPQGNAAYAAYSAALKNSKNPKHNKALLLQWIVTNFVNKQQQGVDKLTWGGNFKGTKDMHHFTWKYFI